MNKSEMKVAIEGRGYSVRDSTIILVDTNPELQRMGKFDRDPSYYHIDKYLGNIKRNFVEVVYGEFYLLDQIQPQIELVADLEELEIPYTEVLDREEMRSLCGTRSAKKDFKSFMIRHASRFLSLAERVDDFPIK